MRVAQTQLRRPSWQYQPSCVFAAFVIALFLSGSTGCTRTSASAPRPDMSGAWDVIYDDYLEAEVRIGATVQLMRVRREGGYLVASGPQGTVLLEVDCAREELLCPHEVWPAELTLNNRTGDLDDEGEHLSVSLASEGRGPCVLRNDSVLGATVVSLGSARDGDWQATALSHGRATTVVSGRCLGARGAASRVQIALSSGFTALRR